MITCPICGSPHYYSENFKIFKCLTCKTIYKKNKEIKMNEENIIPLLEKKHEFNK